MDADVGALPEAGAPPLAAGPGARRDTAELDVAREADPDVAPFLPRLRLVGPEVVVVDQVERTVERLLVVARVVLQAREDAGGVVRERIRRDKVLPPHVDRIELE